jgi:hypothetical protein
VSDRTNLVLGILGVPVITICLIILSMLIAGCAPSDGSTIDRIFTSSEKVNHRHHEKCLNFGYVVGTDEYSECRLVLEILRHRNRSDY